MSFIKEVLTLNFSSFVMSVFLVLSAIIAVYEIICKFSVIIGKPFGAVKQRKADHDLLVKTVKNLEDLHKQHLNDTKETERQNKEIKKDLKELTDMVIRKEINDFRWDINNFATKISENKPCNKDCFQHCFRTYEEYEKILKENNLKNGEVENSMKIINEAYQEKMKKGDFK